ncbi:transposase [Rhodovulum sp. MB263]|uniref:transposase n=1 Tax=Rhodovulum sp. (strain MB263) TaxID=308754 RepID=UPI001E63A3A7|nr:transposase [Rhodovulum sp. MB263]
MTASAIVASIGNGGQFRNGRQFAGSFGLTPGNDSGEGKARQDHEDGAGISGNCASWA